MRHLKALKQLTWTHMRPLDRGVPRARSRVVSAELRLRAAWREVESAERALNTETSLLAALRRRAGLQSTRRSSGAGGTGGTT